MTQVGTIEWWKANTRLDPATGCLLYTNPRPDGYRQVRWKGQHVLVHRLAYGLFNAPLAPDMKVIHTCDRPSCCNPKHLVAGTQKDNLRDMFAKGRARPRGKEVGPRQSFPTETYRAPCRVARQMSNSKTRKGVIIWDILHHIRTREPIGSGVGSSEVPMWCRVTGVPPVRPTQALVKWEPPRSPEVSQREDALNVAELSRHCGRATSGGR